MSKQYRSNHGQGKKSGNSCHFCINNVDSHHSDFVTGKMPKTMKREDILARKRELEKKRYEKIKNNPELYEKYKEKNKAKYEKRKKEGKVVSINSLTSRDQRMVRKKWREDAKKSYQRKKEQKAKMQQFIECNSPPSSDIENINIENIDNVVDCHRELVRGAQANSECKRITRSREVSPATSQCSSVSSGIVSPNAQRLVRKLRYKKDKEIASLRLKLQSVIKLNDAYRKKISRLEPLQNKRTSSIAFKNARLGDKFQLESSVSVQLPREPLLFQPSTSNDNSLAAGVLHSYKGIKSYKMKQMFSNSLKPHLETSLQSTKLKEKFKSVFRRRNGLSKNAPVLQRKEEDVKNFLSDDENSSCAAGKKEYVKKEGVKVQKRYLNDSLGNLYHKFNSSHTYTISFATFCRFKPFWILSASKKPRDTCLCVIHENFRLLVSALHKYKIIEPKDPTNLLKSICCSVFNAACLFRDCIRCKNKSTQYLIFDNDIEFCYWTWNSKVECIVQNGCEKTIRMVKKEKVITKPNEAIRHYEEIIDQFMKHCGKMVSQQKAIKNIKDRLKHDEAVIHVDYSENYKCAYSKEIQSAHFGASKPQVTIHTSVLYFYDVYGLKKTQCFATLSPNLRHDAAAVWAHMEPIIDYLKIHAPQAKTFHIISDSASSQYRNFKIYFIITALRWSHSQLKCVTWNYSESGHGKGAPDGVGAVLKRTADACVNQGADVPDFESFSRLLKRNVKGIVIDTISEYKIFEKDFLLPNTLLPFKGTQQVHQIVWCSTKSASVVLRSLSCIEETCLTKAVYCKHGKHLGFHDVLRQVNTPKPKRKKTMKASAGAPAQVLATCMELNDSDDSFVPSGTSVAEESVTVLHRSTPFSALSEMELPPELQRSTLDSILNEGPAHVTASSLKTFKHVTDDDSDFDYDIF